MFKHRISEDVRLKTYIDWFLLAFLAGNVNSGGWLACHRFVTHVTGFATLAGVEIAHGSWIEALRVLTVPFYFLAGVMISAFLIERRSRKGREPLYAGVMGAVGVLLALAAIGGQAGWFGVFGGDAQGVKQDYFLLALLCAASGLQNAALTSSSGATIRTTHLTGITTDLGIGFVRALSTRIDDPKRASESIANWLRMGTLIAFMFGSAAGATLFVWAGYVGFFLPAAIAFYAMAVALSEN